MAKKKLKPAHKLYRKLEKVVWKYAECALNIFYGEALLVWFAELKKKIINTYWWSIPTPYTQSIIAEQHPMT